jgi:dienelactone hydrolase
MRIMPCLLAAAILILARASANVTSIQYAAHDAARRGRNVDATVVYPVGNSQPCPVIAFAHGFGLSADAYDYIGNGLASAGFIVAFPHSKGAPSSLNLAEDQSFLLAHIVNESETNPQSPFFHLAMNRTALMGHSLGGGTSLIAADPTYLSTNYPAPNAICTLSLGTYTVPPAMKSVPLIPATTPILLFTASEDCIDPPAKNSEPVINAVDSQCAVLHSLIGGCHCQYADKSIGCSTTEDLCGAKPNITRQQQFDRTLLVITPWLDAVLQGKEGAWQQYKSAVGNLKATGALSTITERNSTCPGAAAHP